MGRNNISGTADALLAGVNVKQGALSSENVAFRGGKPPPEIVALRTAYRGKLGGNRVLSNRPGDLLVARDRAAGLFSLRSFQGLSQPRPPVPPPPPAAVGTPHGPAVAVAAAPVLPPAGAPAAPPLDPDARLTEALAAVGANERLVNGWLGTDPRRRTGPEGRTPAAIEQRDRALTAIRATLGELRGLEAADAARIRGGAPAALDADVVADAQRACIRQAALVLMPALAPDRQLPRAERDRAAAALGEMAESVRRLDTALRPPAGGGQAPYDIAKLFTVLAGHGRIGEFAAGRTTEHRLAALEGMQALADTIVEAVTPPRDGAALNSLLGVNAELDGVLKQARLGAVERFMLDSLARSDGGDVGALTDDQRREVRDHARETVEKDAAVAGMKLQVRRGLEAAGGRGLSMTGLGGLRVDAALITGLRAKLGADAKQVGVIVAGLLLAERNAQSAEGARRLLGDVRSRLHTSRVGLAAAVDPAERRALGAEIRNLEERERSLMPEVEVVRARLTEADGARFGLQALVDDAERVARSPVADDADRQALADLQRRLAMAEGNAAIHRAQLRALSPAGGGPVAASPYARASETGGLTTAELQALGLTHAESQEALGAVRRMAEQGLSGAEQVRRLTSDVNSMMAAFRNRSSRVRAAMGNAADVLTSARNEEKPKILASLLLRRLTGDPHANADTLAKPGAARDEVSNRLAQRLAGSPAMADLAGKMAPAGNGFAASDQLYRSAEHRLQRLVVRFDELEMDRGDAEQAIRVFDPGRDVRKAEGLAVSKNLLRAFDLLALKNAGLATPAERAELERLRGSLAGFDRVSLKVPFFQFDKAPLTEAGLAALAADPALRGAARAIVFLREVEPEERAELHTEVAGTVSEMDRVASEREGQMGPAWHTVRDAVRLAVLTVHAEAGAPAEFRPGEHADAVRGLLRAWGVPVDSLKPEINIALSETFGPEELTNWSRLEDPRRRGEALPAADATSPFSQKTRSALLDAVDHLANGTKVRLTAGGQVTVQSGKIPLTPVVGLNAKAAVSSLHGMEIARGPDGYELAIRDGWDGKLGLETSVGLSAVPVVNVSVAANLEGSHMAATGVSLRFPNDARGLEGLKNLLGKVFGQESLTARDLAAADQIVPIVESRTGAKAAVEGRAKVGLQAPHGVLWDFGTVGVSAGVKAGASASGSETRHTARNTNQVQIKRDREVALDVSAGARAQYDFGIRRGEHQPSASSDALALTATTGVVYRAKVKEVYGPDGLVAAGTERARQMYLPAGPAKWAIVERMGGDEFRRGFGALPAEKRDAVRKMVDIAGSNDLINVAFALKEPARAAANERLAEAKALRSGRAIAASDNAAAKRAEALERQAQAILDDDGNYGLARVQLVPTRETLDDLTVANLVFVQFHSYLEEKGEFVAAQVTA